jgi:hypothetical protein
METGRLQRPIERTLENCGGIRLEAAPVAEDDAFGPPCEDSLNHSS